MLYELLVVLFFWVIFAVQRRITIFFADIEILKNFPGRKGVGRSASLIKLRICSEQYVMHHKTNKITE